MIIFAFAIGLFIGAAIGYLVHSWAKPLSEQSFYELGWQDGKCYGSRHDATD